MAVRLLGKTESILDGALPIWERLATLLNSLAGHWPKLGFENGRDEAHGCPSAGIVLIGDWATVVCRGDAQASRTG